MTLVNLRSPNRIRTHWHRRDGLGQHWRLTGNRDRDVTFAHPNNFLHPLLSLTCNQPLQCSSTAPIIMMVAEERTVLQRITLDAPQTPSQRLDSSSEDKPESQ